MVVTIASLLPGDLIEMRDGRILEVVSVVDEDGAMGGLVDCKRPGGRHSRTAGFEFGRDVVRVLEGPVRHRSGFVALG